MTLEKAAACMAELGHQKRLSVFKFLVQYGNQGIETGKIADSLSIANSTLTHHLKRLVSVNLIEQKQDKQKIYCYANIDLLNQVIGFLTDNCCKRSGC